MTRTGRTVIVTALIVVALFSAAAADDLRVTARVDRTAVSLNHIIKHFDSMSNFFLILDSHPVGKPGEINIFKIG